MKNKTVNNNIKILFVFILMLFIFIYITLYKIVYINKNYYKNKLSFINNKIVYGSIAPRGRIYDRNYKVLVDNKTEPIIIYKKHKNISIAEEIELAKSMVNILNLNYDKNKAENIKKFYYLQHKKEIESRISNKEIESYKKKLINEKEYFNLKLNKISEKEFDNISELDKKASYIYYLMNNGYSYNYKIIKDKNVTDYEYSYILENESELKGFSGVLDVVRYYPYGSTFKSIFGNIKTIPYEDKENYIERGYDLNDKVGTSFLEKYYESILKGDKAKYKRINNLKLNKISDVKKGKDIVLGIDIDLQKEVDKIIVEEIKKAKLEPNTNLFNKTYVVIQDAKTGEILAMSGKEILDFKSDIVYDITPNIISSSYTPGSVVKGASMMVGYTTGVIDIGYKTTDECIKIKSSPRKCSSHRVGSLNDIIALSESSNVYQFKIAIKVGKGKYKYNHPLKLDMKAFDTYRNKFKEFGLGSKTGIDLFNEQVGFKGKNKDTNLLLNFSIGQYDSYTPIELSQYITTIANNGNRLKPHLVREIIDNNKKDYIKPIVLNRVTGDIKFIKRIQKGFRQVLIDGTGKNIMGNSPNPAGKTGTSESFIDTNKDGIIDRETVSNAFVGYAPYNNPEITITVVSPDVEEVGTGINYHSYVNRRITKRISNYYFSSKNK